MMTCDEAFEALTDPFAGELPDLEQHLAACARCRQMSEVLAPALALFVGSAPAEPACAGTAEGRSPQREPANSPLSAAALRAAEDTARRLSARRPRRFRPPRLSGLLRLAAVFLLGVGAAFGVAQLGTEGPDHPRPGAIPRETCLWTARREPPFATDRPEQLILSCVACHLPAE